MKTVKIKLLIVNFFWKGFYVFNVLNGKCINNKLFFVNENYSRATTESSWKGLEFISNLSVSIFKHWGFQYLRKGNWSWE